MLVPHDAAEIAASNHLAMILRGMAAKVCATDGTPRARMIHAMISAAISEAIIMAGQEEVAEWLRALGDAVENMDVTGSGEVSH